MGTPPPDLAVSAQEGEQPAFGTTRPVRALVTGFRPARTFGSCLRLYLTRPLLLDGADLRSTGDRDAVAHFEYGSNKGCTRSMFVPRISSHLLAAWTRSKTSSPMPARCRIFQAPPAAVDPVPGWRSPQGTHGDSGTRSGMARVSRPDRHERARDFTCKQGDVFIWHAGLMHGGAPVQTHGRTRKSFVIHYSTAATCHARSAPYGFTPPTVGPMNACEPTSSHKKDARLTHRYADNCEIVGLGAGPLGPARCSAGYPLSRRSLSRARTSGRRPRSSSTRTRRARPRASCTRRRITRRPARPARRRGRGRPAATARSSRPRR